MDIRPIDANALLEKIRFREGLFMGQREIFLIEGEPTLSLNTLRDEVYQDALEHGLWRPEANTMAGAQLIRGEAMELIYEAGYTNKPSHEYETELADVFIMCLSVAGKFGIDIDAAVKRKMEINKHRPWKHEGEKHEG